MNKHYLIELLHKSLKGEATIEEERFLVNYYNLFEHEPEVTDLLSADKKETLKKQMHSAIWDNISRQMEADKRHTEADKKIPSISRWPARMVAAAVLLVVSVTGFYFLHTMPVKKQAEPIAGVANPKRANHFVSLPDGSTVVLHFGSKLDYPSSFDGLAKREVYLEGQAFFDIRHNASKSFIVHTGKLETTVLGTTFNIKAFAVDREITVTVKSGEVKVSDEHKTLGIIRPDQQIIYNIEKANVTRKTVNTDSYLEWKGQDLLFDNLTVEAAAKLLEKRFNVTISISDPSIGTKRFTTTFSSKESLEEALVSMCEFNGAAFNYNKEKATIIISNK